MSNKKKCFVIMPFSETKSCTKEKWMETFEYIIKPAVEESGLGYDCERSVAERENIIKGILEALNKANVVIADLTDNNPNVFYELGVRHTLTNRTILIAQGEEHIPFDLRPYPVAFYSESPAKIAEFKSDIKKKLKDIEANPDRADNPVADFLKERNISLLSFEKSTNLKKLTALISELSLNIYTVDTILNQVKETQQKRKKGEKWPRATTIRFSNASLEFLLTTQYILLPQELLELINLSNREIKLINGHLDVRPDFGEEVEEKLISVLPDTRKQFIDLLQRMNQISLDYANDNYPEPIKPAIILTSPEHEEYLEIIE